MSRLSLMDVLELPLYSMGDHTYVSINFIKIVSDFSVKTNLKGKAPLINLGTQMALT